mgnify:CR=1 FL=1
MYNDYFGFKEAPFSIAPDPRYLYMTPQHREALAHLVFGLNSEGGCILLTGEVGTGKTTICRCLLEQIPDQANVALVLNPKVNETELLESICDELDIDYPESDNSLKTYTDRIYNFLIESNRRNEKTVLIIDEAQNLDSKVLEQLRLLTNLETDKRKLLQIIILGQPELLDILAKNEMRQLAQRITARFHLQPLDKMELKAYISHRLAVAGQSIQLFPENSIKLIYKLSKGVPRLINIICDRALLGAYVENQYTVTPTIIKKAAIEVFGELKVVEQNQRVKRWLYPLTAAAGVVFLISALLAFYLYNRNNSDVDLLPAIAIENNGEKPVGSDDSNNQSIENAAATTDSLAQQRPSTDAINSDLENSLAVSSPGNDGKQDSSYAKENTATDGLDSETVEEQEKQITAVTDNNDKSTATNSVDDISAMLESAPNDPATAYQQLFRTWGQQYEKNTRLTACKQAEKFSLSCLYRHGNINSLRLHNRPAVLTLLDDQGGKRYITISAIDGDIASVYSNNQLYRVKLKEIDRYWYGQFILIWDKPEDYSAVIKPGDSGDIIYWLNRQLEKINNTHSPDIIISKYDSYLVDKVKAFQSEQGLIADGMVGPITIIHLNNELGAKSPSLTPLTTSIKSVTQSFSEQS